MTKLGLMWRYKIVNQLLEALNIFVDMPHPIH